MVKEKKTILIIEDDETLRVMYRDRLTEDGYLILEAEDSKSGMLLARNKKPNLIILDLILPQGNGFELLEKLKKDDQTKKIPVVVLTNLGQDSDRQEIMQLGADDYLVKPETTPSELISLIKKYIAD